MTEMLEPPLRGGGMGACLPLPLPFFLAGPVGSGRGGSGGGGGGGGPVARWLRWDPAAVWKVDGRHLVATAAFRNSAT